MAHYSPWDQGSVLELQNGLYLLFPTYLLLPPLLFVSLLCQLCPTSVPADGMSWRTVVTADRPNVCCMF